MGEIKEVLWWKKLRAHGIVICILCGGEYEDKTLSFSSKTAIFGHVYIFEIQHIHFLCMVILLGPTF
jgi:hypothetical protein